MPSLPVPAELLKGKHSSSLQLEDILFNTPPALAAAPGEGSGAPGAADGPSEAHQHPASSNGVMQGEGQPGAHARPVSKALDPAVTDIWDHRAEWSARTGRRASPPAVDSRSPYGSWQTPSCREQGDAARSSSNTCSTWNQGPVLALGSMLRGGRAAVCFGSIRVMQTEGQPPRCDSFTSMMSSTSGL